METLAPQAEPDRDAREPLDAALQMLLDVLTKGNPPRSLPGSLDQNDKLTELLNYLGTLQKFAMSLSAGDLSSDIRLKGQVVGSLKNLQASLRHLTWQTQMIAQGDFSQRVDFMGDFSTAFNTMTAHLEEAHRRILRDEEELKQVNTSLVSEIAEREQAEDRLRERVLFETLLSNLSARFVNLPAEEIDEALQHGLRMIVESLDVDRGSLVEFRGDQTRKPTTYSYMRPDVPQPPLARADSNWPWWGKKMRAGEIIAMERPDDLPPEAESERQVALEIGLKSYLAIPLMVEKGLIGYITFPSYQHERAWPQELIPRLKLIGDIFASALARKRAEDLLRERILFETLLSNLSARFVNLPAEEIDEALEHGLRMIVEFLDVDRGSLVEVSDDLTDVMLISTYARPNIPTADPAHAVKEWQRWTEELREGNIIAVERTDELPAEAGREKDDAITAGLKSYLAVPLSVGRAMRGFIAFLSFRHERAWPQELIPRLQIIGQVFANAVERKRADEELRQSNAELQTRNEELDAFAHTVAHDLKNPVAMMILSADVLQEDVYCSDDQEAKEIIAAVSHSARKMDSIIDELLLLSQVRQADVQTQPLDMNAIVQEACQRLASMSAGYAAEITQPAASEWPVAMGYGPWIEEVWANYIGNAIKYGGKPPRIELGADPLPDPAGAPQAGGRMVRFWVRDNGAGLAPEEQARLFAVFERLGQVHVSGSGLGLSIVKRIVEKLGGQVGVESEPGHGSTFYFTLPAAPSE